MKILFISPNFFSYHLLIKKELEDAGFEVDWIDDRSDSGFLKRSILRLFPSIGVNLLEKKFLKIISKLSKVKYKHILVIKGEGVSLNVVNNIREIFPHAKMGLYLWDSIENSKNSLKISSVFDSVSTFDPLDAERNKWNYVPLFSKDIKYEVSSGNKIVYDFSFVGSLHCDRNSILNMLYAKYSKKYEIFFYLYSKNFVLKIYKSLYDSSIIKNNKFIKNKVMDFDRYKEILKSSNAVVDIEHPSQNGLTMRTIETLLSGKKLITTNKKILECDLYHPSRVIVIDRENPVISEYFMKSDFLKIDESVAIKYSCKEWIANLIALQS